jgi:hypothetical protein
MGETKEPFVERWSRLKREQEKPEVPAPAKEGSEPAAVEPVLPPLEALTPESDFAPFMNPKVAEITRRAALKKLFQDPRYNVVDKFEAYWEDFTKDEGIPPELLEKLDQARRHVFGDNMQEAPPPAAGSEQQAEAPRAEGQPPQAAEKKAAATETQGKNGAGTQDA